MNIQMVSGKRSSDKYPNLAFQKIMLISSLFNSTLDVLIEQV